ncbi:MULTISPECIES: PIG-L deacetylase family protein [unclassified Mesorhizobium]|uniref:PIG-L deacetylase family protein n=1 Tax=unclassified Mesorhizobium TaxID=325217 RepID=UPI000F7534A8|nr:MULTISPECIES: PIG-L deacetylase family protein [unclassified Mesorhizobium]AZO09399.1 PIG-L family deacetylase [Mesorhizobium sp. M3A.F.Ca.ET.080.04.2.1]RWB68001.1 MAG: PIG-L family deacetylase [Mesorhizobium sp.]RWB87758.1 MAG: PIG-L family deacetylase [Mesorhizobium sp.]RWE36221.1 MAG: PIG-L family deacetylase [Mesorhizobium sp.]RWF26308.1 MAG: PIG-L family deacetylase [Mesorhizobium sp.]
MKGLGLARRGEDLSILCLGAHSDDIEIGAGGTILSLIASGTKLNVHWCVLSAGGQRSAEARASAEAFLQGANSSNVEVADFEDSFFPAHSRSIKHWLIDVRSRTAPDVVFTHARYDAHQDHREVNQLTWNVFRDHLVLEYEIPKWDGDLGQPNAYVPLAPDVLERKIDLLHEHFGTQRSKDWFDRDTFVGLARLRGMECRAPQHFAEAFTLRKAKIL